MANTTVSWVIDASQWLKDVSPHFSLVLRKDFQCHSQGGAHRSWMLFSRCLLGTAWQGFAEPEPEPEPGCRLLRGVAFLPSGDLTDTRGSYLHCSLWCLYLLNFNHVAIAFLLWPYLEASGNLTRAQPVCFPPVWMAGSSRKPLGHHCHMPLVAATNLDFLLYSYSPAFLPWILIHQFSLFCSDMCYKPLIAAIDFEMVVSMVHF